VRQPDGDRGVSERRTDRTAVVPDSAAPVPSAADIFAEAAGVAEPGDETAPVRPRILLFFDYACPFCFVDRFRFEKLERETGAEVLPIPFELRPDMPDEGVSAVEYGLDHPPHVEEFLKRQASAEGCEMLLPDLVPKTHRAMVAGEVARDAGPEIHRRLHGALFDAHYVQGRDIGDPSVVLAVAEEAGLLGRAVENAWERGTHERRLADFKDLAHFLGVGGTPAAVICNELLIGTRPYTQLAESVKRCLITPESAGGDAPTP
jgi:predicted DsbA family dithiol-disulfide isomerase